MADGFSLNVDPKFLQNLDEADKRIQKIADTMEATSKRIIKSFQDINSQGLDVFVNKMNDVNKVISSLSDKKISISNILGGKSQTAKSVDDINKLIELLNKLSQETKKTQGANKRGGLFGDMSKSVSDWQALQKQISENEKQISKLTQSTREYESTMKRIQSGKGGVIHGGASKEYQENIKNIETLRQQNASLQQKQQLIIQNNQALQAQANLQQQLKQYNQQQGSLPEQRKSDELKRMNDYYRELEKSSKRASEESIKSSEKEAKARERAERASKKQSEAEAKRQQRAAQSRETQILNAYNQAMKANEATINQRINKLAKLRQVESQLAQDEAKYSSQLSRVRSEIDRLSQANDKAAKSTKQLQSNQRNLMDTTGQLQRKLALLFSVSAIQGYISKLIDVRGEFEMQQRSLQVLLRNKDEADKLWQQTIDLAVKSPFRVKQLVTYTRQLAAYRIETDKLHDTTRRLSDVSAGLGVDMQRIILAFGQVRAANFLRGTELRQFTEAGIPMLDELAKYFTELEGRAISAGDVFEMISKRMVSFSDVEEVFHRMTNAGGVFYKMQEEQSKTLSGLISNLHDSIDLMLNDIGKANDGVLKSSINTMRQFVDNWREVAYTLEKVVIAYSLYKIANAAFILGSKNATTTTLWWNNALKAKIGTTMADIQTMTLQEASLYGVSKGQYAAGKATMFFQGAIRGVGLALKMAAPFLLAFMAIEIVRYFTAASRAADELQRELEEIYQSDYTNFKKQSDTLKDLVERLKNVTKGSQEHKDIISRLNSSYGEYLGNLNEETATYENLAASIDKTVMALSQKAKAQTLEKAIAKSFEKTNKEIMSLQEDITKGMERLVRESGGAMLVPQEQEINDFFNLFEKRTKEAGELLDRSDINKILSEYYGENVMITSDIDFSHFVSLGEQILEQKQQEEKVQRQINNLYGEGIYSTQKAREEFQKLEEDKAKALQNEKTRIGRQKIETQFEMARIDLQVKYEGLDKNIADYRKSLVKGISATVEDINRQIIESIPELGEDVADKIFIDQATAATGLESIAESTAQAYKGQLELIRQQNALKDAGTVYDQKLLSNAERMAKGYYKRLEIMGRLDLLKKSSNDSDSKELQLLNRQLSAIKDASSAFESLSDIYGGEEAKKKVTSSFANLFKELNISEITDDMDFDALGVVRVLNKLPNIAGERGEQAIEKLKAEFNSEIDVDLKIGRVKTIEEQISKLFSGYELSIELDKMNIPEDFAQSLFNIDATNLPALKEQVKSFEDELIALGDKGVEIWNKSQKKIEEVEQKIQLERLKKYVKYMLQAQSERVKIKIDEMNQLSEIEKLNVSELDKNIMRQGVREETQKKLDKAAWEDFKNSDMYIRIFEDLDRASSKALSAMHDKLIELRGSLSELSPENLKEIVRLEEQIAKAKIEDNPFAGLIQSMKNLKSARKELNKLEEEHGFTYEEGIQVYEKQKKKIEELQISIKKLTDEYGADTPNAVFEKEDLGTLTKANKKLAEILEKMGLLNSKATSSTIGIQESFGGMSDIFSQAAQSTNDIANALDKMGALGDAQKDNFETIAGIFGGMSGIMSGAEKIASGNPFEIVAGAIESLGGVASIVGEIFAIGDKKKERQIQREIKLVEDLERAYEKLEKAIDSAYSINTLKASGKSAKQNLESQIDSYKKMIAAEEDKKKTDHDRIKEWQLAIEDLIEQKAELDKQLVSTATRGIMDDVLSAAQEFTNAWLDAFKETGDGLSGLESNFKETMLEMVKQQAAMLISQSYIDRWKKQLEQYINPSDLELSTDEARKWVNAVSTSLPQLNDALEKYFTAMQQAGVDISGSGELSGLQRGIQGVTEETAQIIEAYLNSIRFFVAEQNTYLSQIAATFGNTEVENPMVEQLRIIAAQTSAINSLLQGLVRGGHSLGGTGLKVFIS